MAEENFRIKSWLKLNPGYVLAALIIAGFAIGLIGDGFAACPSQPGVLCDTLTDLLAQDNSYVAYNHAYYQMLTSIFVTDSVLDAGFNAIAVLVIDRFMDPVFNKTRYFATFFLTALFGNVLTLINGPAYASAGASGGIFGLLAATFSFSWAENRRIDSSTLILFLIVFGTSSFIIPEVNWIAHLGGSIAGFIIGPVLYYSLKPKLSRFESVSESSKSAQFIVGALILLAALLSAAQFFLFVLT